MIIAAVLTGVRIIFTLQASAKKRIYETKEEVRQLVDV